MNLPEGQPFLLAGDIEAPTPLRKPDETFGMEVESYEGTVEFVLPLAAATNASGAKTLTVAVRYQVCDDKLCLPPRTVRVAAPVELR
jgi:thiol:disulfide interchange protein DsbD